MIEVNNTLDATENISYAAGTVTKVDYEKGTADIEGYKNLSVEYACMGSAADAFAIGDDVIVRKFAGVPSHIIGFTGDMWPSLRTPALIFDEGAPYIYRNRSAEKLPIRFYDRYEKLDEYDCAVSHTFYLNNNNAETNDAFTTIEHDWTDGRYNRDTKFYYKDELIYQTYNNETYDGVFNGTRSNVFGRFIHPESGEACMVYQVNTFYDWLPRVSGRVSFDFYIYISGLLHTRLASAKADVTGYSTQAEGSVLSEALCTALTTPDNRSILKAELTVREAGDFTSDGSTNYIGYGGSVAKSFAVASESCEFTALNNADVPSFKNGIYIKRR